MKGKIEIIDEGETIRIRGQLTLKAMDEKPKVDEVLGVTQEDISKGQIGKIII